MVKEGPPAWGDLRLAQPISAPGKARTTARRVFHLLQCQGHGQQLGLAHGEAFCCPVTWVLQPQPPGHRPGGTWSLLWVVSGAVSAFGLFQALLVLSAHLVAAFFSSLPPAHPAARGTGERRGVPSTGSLQETLSQTSSGWFQGAPAAPTPPPPRPPSSGHCVGSRAGNRGNPINN